MHAGADRPRTLASGRSRSLADASSTVAAKHALERQSPARGGAARATESARATVQQVALTAPVAPGPPHADPPSSLPSPTSLSNPSTGTPTQPGRWPTS